MRCTFRKPLKFKGAYIGTDEERNAYEIIAAFTVAGHKQENNILSSFTQGLVLWSVFVRKNSREHLEPCSFWFLHSSTCYDQSFFEW